MTLNALKEEKSMNDLYFLFVLFLFFIETLFMFILKKHLTLYVERLVLRACCCIRHVCLHLLFCLANLH